MSESDVEQLMNAATAVSGALDRLRPEQRVQVLTWALAKYGANPDTRAPEAIKTKVNVASEGYKAANESKEPDSFAVLADLLAAAKPQTEALKALVAVYWRQVSWGETEIVAQTINNELKSTHHGIRNISRALDSLHRTKPQLIEEVPKIRATEQARKTYKLTVAGRRMVESMVRAEKANDRDGHR